MTEKENNIPYEGKESLTNKPNPSKLGSEGEIFMNEESSPGAHDIDREGASKSATAVAEVSISKDSIREVLEQLGVGGVKEKSAVSEQINMAAKKTAESFFPEGGGEEVKEFQADLTKAIYSSDSYNREHSSPEKIYQEMLSRLKKANSQEEFISLLAGDVAWASMITNIRDGIRDGTLNIEEFKDKKIKESFLSDLDIANGLILRARKGKLAFENEEGFNNSRNLFLRLVGLETENQTREEEKIQDVTLGDFIHRFEGQLGYETLLNSMEDLARLIMTTEDPEWRTGGSHELLDKEGKFKSENFLAWIRSRILYYHDLNPDSEINLFSDIGVTTNYRAVNFAEMMAYAKYFMTEVNKPNPKMGMLPTQDYELKKEQKNLKELVMHEVWLFQMSHNFNVKYHMIEGQEAKVPEALAEIHYNNVFTKNKNRLLKILMLSGNNPEELGWIIGKDKIEQQERQGSVGKDIQRVMLAYYYLSEIAYEDVPKGEKNMFEEALGDEGVLKFYKSIIGELAGAEVLRRVSGETDKEKIKWIAKKYLKEKQELKLEDLNIFNHPKKPEAIKELVANAMVAAISDERILYKDLKEDYLDLYKQLCSGFSVGQLTNQEIKHAKDEAKYAVEWVGTMVRWMGIQARNDTKAIGFDGWSKVMNTSQYRLGQYKEGKSAVGNIQNVFGFRRIGLNFLEATTVSQGDAHGEESFKRSLLEILQGGRGDKIDLRRNIAIFEFKGNAQRKFIEDHVYNAFEFYKYITTKHGIDYSKMVKRGAYGQLQINEEERDKLFREFWKNARYAFDLPEFLYGHKVRGWWTEILRDETGKEKEVLKFGEKKLEEFMFDEEVLSLNLYGDENGELKDDGTNRGLFGSGYREPFEGEFNEEEKPRHVRKKLARLAFGYFIAKDLWAHRKGDEGYHWYSSMDIAAIEYLFQNFPYGIEEEEVDGYKSTKKKSSFFTAEEFDQIARMAHSRYKDVFRQELKRESAGTIILASWAGILKFVQAVIKGY